jgi:selenocysteine-specific elongation factor
VTILPSGRRARVRSVQVHDAPVEVAAAGQRVALNLAGVRLGEVVRGDVVAQGAIAPTYRVDARLVAEGLESGARVTVHHGTREAPARAVRRANGVWQLRLEAPIVALAGDRIVVRSIAPPDTLGGGVIVDAAPRRRTRPEEPEPAAEPPAPAGPSPLSDAAAATAERLRTLDPPPDAEFDPGHLRALREHGLAVRLGPAHHVHADTLAHARERVIALIEAEGPVTLARVRDELGSSRRVVQLLLERLDADRVTLRRGDERVLRRRRPAG